MIPPKTAQKLIESHPEGTRHQAKLEIALSLLGNGLPASAVAQTLAERFPNASRGEIEGVVNWCQSKNPTPTEYRNGTKLNGHTPPTMTPEEAVARLVEGDAISEQEWKSISPVPIPENPADHAACLIEHLYQPGEFVCGLCAFGVKEDGRVYPVGAGYTRTREQWLERISTKGMVSTKAGCWWRMNPVKEKGSGKDGATTDADVTAFRYALVEHDKLPLEDQLSVLAKFVTLTLPVAAIIATGGKSFHAWVELNAENEKDYAEKIGRLLDVTKPLGFDHNRNPSRLARIPGVKRELGASGDGWQKLIFLNPNPKPFDWHTFEVGATPIKNIVNGVDLIMRVREWMKPRQCAFTLSLLRGPTPEEGLYFREGEVTLWSGVTGHGKSSLLKQTMLECCAAAIPFFVASFEHKAEDICEGLARAAKRSKPTTEDVEQMLHEYGSMMHFLDIVGEASAEELLSAMRSCSKRHGSKQFFVDSLMRISGLEEDYPAQTKFLNDLQAFAKETKGHVHLVTHPRKVDETQRVRKMDVKGSANIANNADNIITVRRNVQKQDADENGKSVAGIHDAEISVEKQRATGWQGIARLKFDAASKTFSRFYSDDKPKHRNWSDQP